MHARATIGKKFMNKKKGIDCEKDATFSFVKNRLFYSVSGAKVIPV